MTAIRTGPATAPPAPPRVPAADPSIVDRAGFRPAAVVDVDVSRPLPPIPAAVPASDPRADPTDDPTTGPGGRVRGRAWVLVRVFGEPIGTVELPIPPDGLAPTALAAAIDRRFGPAIRQRAADAGAAPDGPVFPAGLPVDGIATPAVPRFVADREAALAHAPSVSVVICTRDRPDVLGRCLHAVLAQRYPDFRVIVVDNAPSTSGTWQCVVRAADSRIDYVVEPRPGLSWARNRGVAAARGEVIASIDDDEVPDPNWLAEIARAFHLHPDADAVTGAILPAELETWPQEWFERFGGHSKGRGFTPAVFSTATAHEQSPLYPLPPFGAGGNMAFRRESLAAVGEFDPALGAGTVAMGAEDTQMFTRLLLAGGTIAYQPSALVWHYHYRDLAGLRRQMRGYGVGLTAYYTSLVWQDVRRVVPLARLLPTALRDVLGRKGQSIATVGDDYPKALLSANRRGMLGGPWRYVRSRLRARGLRAKPGAGVAR